MAHLGPTISRHTAKALRSNRDRGFSLLEVLVALLILSVGLLGIAGLQTVSLKFNHQSYERTQATVLISEMIEKIMANPVATRAGSFDLVDTLTDTFTGYGACPTSCTPTQLATYDLSRWQNSMNDPRKLAQGRGTIARMSAAPEHVFKVTVTWVESNMWMQQDMQVRTQRNQ